MTEESRLLAQSKELLAHDHLSELSSRTYDRPPLSVPVRSSAYASSSSCGKVLPQSARADWRKEGREEKGDWRNEALAPPTANDIRGGQLESGAVRCVICYAGANWWSFCVHFLPRRAHRRPVPGKASCLLHSALIFPCRRSRCAIAEPFRRRTGRTR